MNKVNKFIIINYLEVILIIIIFFISFYLRSINLYGTLTGPHLARELNTALMTKGLVLNSLNPLKPNMYYSPSGPEWEGGAIEFPLYNYIIIIFYLLFGENIYLGRVCSILFNLLSGILLFKISDKHFGRASAFISLIIFLFSPLSALIGRSYQPESLLTFFIILSIYFLFDFYDSKKRKDLCLSVFFLSLGALVKIFALHLLFPIFIIYLYYKKRGIKNAKLDLFLIIAMLMTVFLWYAIRISLTPYGVKDRYFSFLIILFNVDSLKHCFDLLLHETWTKWGTIFFIVSLFFIPKMKYKLIYLTWLISIGIYAIYTISHFSTHNYYQAPLLPFTSLITANLFFTLGKKNILYKKMYFHIILNIVFILLYLLLILFILTGFSSIKQILARPVDQLGFDDATRILSKIGTQDDLVAFVWPYWEPLYPAVFNEQEGIGIPINNLDENTIVKLKQNKFKYIVLFYAKGNYIENELEYDQDTIRNIFKHYKLIKQGEGYLLFDLDRYRNSNNTFIINKDKYYERKVIFDKTYSISFIKIKEKVRKNEQVALTVKMTNVKHCNKRVEPFMFLKSSFGKQIWFDKPVLLYFLPTDKWNEKEIYKIEFTINKNSLDVGVYEVMFGIYDIRKCTKKREWRPECNLNVTYGEEKNGQRVINLGVISVE